MFHQHNSFSSDTVNSIKTEL